MFFFFLNLKFSSRGQVQLPMTPLLLMLGFLLSLGPTVSGPADCSIRLSLPLLPSILLFMTVLSMVSRLNMRAIHFLRLSLVVTVTGQNGNGQMARTKWYGQNG